MSLAEIEVILLISRDEIILLICLRNLIQMLLDYSDLGNHDEFINFQAIESFLVGYNSFYF